MASSARMLLPLCCDSDAVIVVPLQCCLACWLVAGTITAGWLLFLHFLNIRIPLAVWQELLQCHCHCAIVPNTVTIALLAQDFWGFWHLVDWFFIFINLGMPSLAASWQVLPQWCCHCCSLCCCKLLHDKSCYQHHYQASWCCFCNWCLVLGIMVVGAVAWCCCCCNQQHCCLVLLLLPCLHHFAITSAILISGAWPLPSITTIAVNHHYHCRPSTIDGCCHHCHCQPMPYPSLPFDCCICHHHDCCC